MVTTWQYSNTDASATIKSGPGVIHSMTLIAAAANATAIIYDNTAASGTVIWKLNAVANGSASITEINVPFSTGCHVALTGASASFSIAYR